MDGRIARANCREDAWKTRLGKLESMREEMYAFNMNNPPSPGEIGFDFRSPIGLHLGQAESIPHNWADIQKSDFL